MKPRARRTALMVASVPLETKRIFSIEGIGRVLISCASSYFEFGGDAVAGAAFALDWRLLA